MGPNATTGIAQSNAEGCVVPQRNSHPSLKSPSAAPSVAPLTVPSFSSHSHGESPD
jgi:hypothetical protein